MKKFLLFALTAVIAVSASAQTIGNQKTGNAQRVAKNVQMTPAKMATMSNAPAAIMTAGPSTKAKFGQKLSLTGNFTPSKKVVAAPKKADLQAEYNGLGTDHSDNTRVSWTMKPATAEGGATVLIDVIPNPWKAEEKAEVPAEYTLNGDVITIQPQLVGQWGSYYIFLAGGESDDNTIQLTVGEDGSLTMANNESILYGVFSSDEFDPTYTSTRDGGTYAGYLEIIDNVQYLKPGEKIIPAPNYVPDDLYLMTGLNVDFSYGLYGLLPAYASVAFMNRTTDPADAFEWSTTPVAYNSETKAYEPIADPITGDTQDFAFFTEGDMAYSPVSLTASFEGETSDPFYYTDSEKGCWYAGIAGSEFDWQDEATPSPIISKANPSTSLSLFNMQGVYGQIYYQGKPASPFYFTGVNMMLYNFEQKEGFNLTCKIQKCTRDPQTGKLEMGDVVAQADLDLEDIQTGTQCTMVNWNNFYYEDELGMNVDLDGILVDYEFAIVVEGWDNGTFSGSPIYSKANIPATMTYAIVSGATEYTGSAWWSAYGNVFIGFKGAVYGYLYTEDETELNIPAEGGEASIHVKPMYCSNTDDENGNKTPTTRLWLTDDSEDIPEWLTFRYDNETYDQNAEDFEGFGFDLVAVAAANETDEPRSATISFMQEGAKLVVTVNQPQKGAGVASVSVAKASNKSFNVLGQRVNKNFRGIVIENGKKIVK